MSLGILKYLEQNNFSKNEIQTILKSQFYIRRREQCLAYKLPNGNIVVTDGFPVTCDEVEFVYRKTDNDSLFNIDAFNEEWEQVDD